MPAQENAFRQDRVVYWEYLRPNSLNEPVCLAPVEVKVRWDDKQVNARTAQGDTVTLDAQIVAKQEMVPRSIVLHESLSFFQGTGSDSDLGPLPLYEVMTNDKTPDIKNRAQAYVIGLQRYKGDLPTIGS